MSHVEFANRFMGFGPLTSDAFTLSEDLPALQLPKGTKMWITLSPYYKRGNQSLYLNLFSNLRYTGVNGPGQGSRKDDHMHEHGYKCKVYRNRAGVIDVAFPGFPPNASLTDDQLHLQAVIQCLLKKAKVWNGATAPRLDYLLNLDWDVLMGFTNPIPDAAYIRSLPVSTYRAQAQRWTGLSADEAPRRIDGVIDAITKQAPVSPCKAHPGWKHSFEHPLVLATEEVQVPHPMGHNAAAPAPAAAPTVNPTPQSAPSVTPPPMPSGTEDLATQIASLTQRAKIADDMAVEVSILKQRNDKLQADIEELKNRPQVVISTSPKFTGNGNVMIGGKEMEHFDLAPLGDWSVADISPTYDLDGWGAHFKCGDLEESFTIGDVMQGILTTTPTRLIGPPATGKTSGIVQACAHMGIPCRVIQCGKGLTEYTLLGEQTIENGNVVWRDGVLPKLCREVVEAMPHIIVFDEIDHLSPPIQSLLHGVLEGRTLDLPNGEKVTIPENVICVATANTYGTGDVTGRHAAAAVSDDAFISRWTRTFTVSYLNPDREKELLLSHGIPSSRIDGLMQFIKGTRDSAEAIDKGNQSDGVRTPVTLRTLLPLAQECGGDDKKFNRALLTTVFGQFSPDEMQHARELSRYCMGI